MEDFTRDELEYALICLDQLMKSRNLNQTQLHQASKVPQPTISKVLHRTQEPTTEVLRKLFKGLGLDLNDIIKVPDAAAQELVGYLATPLTGLKPIEDRNIREIVALLKRFAAADEFKNPHFDLYWPGDFTHPKDNPDFTPDQVYRTDRARASSYSFVVLLCAAPSFGVGQENEIATQAGLPAIRLIPKQLSRMMQGSFIKATDICYSGTLETGIFVDEAAFKEALRSVQRTYFSQLPLYRGLNGHDFGRRLEDLINNRYGDFNEFADRLGVNVRYIRALIDEPFVVSNPSARLLKRMAVLLDVSVGYLLGETREADPLWSESYANWRAWLRDTTGLDADISMEVLEQWQQSYKRNTQKSSVISFRDNQTPTTAAEWDKLYKQIQKKRAAASDAQPGLF